MKKYYIIPLLLLCLGLSDLRSQSVFIDQGEDRVGAQFSYSNLNSNSGYNFLFSYSDQGRVDFGLSYGWVNSRTFSVFGNGDRFNAHYIAPQVGFLLVKSKSGFNFGANAGIQIGLSKLANNDTDLLYGLSASQRFGDKNATYLLPFINLSRSSLSDLVAIGGGVSLVLPNKENSGITTITPNIQSVDSQVLYSLSLGIIFKSNNSNKPASSN